MPVYPAFVKETKKKKNARKRRYDGEAKEAEEALVQMKSGEVKSTRSQINMCLLLACSEVNCSTTSYTIPLITHLIYATVQMEGKML